MPGCNKQWPVRGHNSSSKRSRGPDYQAWRNTLLRRTASLAEDSVSFSHFIAINVVVAAARNDDAVVCFRPDHASITVIETQLGQQAQSLVLARS